MSYRLVTLFLLSLTLTLPVQAQTPSAEELIQQLGIAQSAVASRDMKGWSRPSKIVFYSRGLAESGPGSRVWWREAADGVDLVFLDAASGSADWQTLEDADAYFGSCSAKALGAGKQLRYIHLFTAGIDRCTAIPGIAGRGLIATNSAKASSETIAEHSIGLMLALTRNLYYYQQAQMKSEWSRSASGTPQRIAVKGKTMLVLGLGGIGTQVARRAHDLGMTVIATRNSSRDGPDYVSQVGLSGEMIELAARADVVVNAMPLTNVSRGSVNGDFFSAMKDSSYYISVGRGATTDTNALMKALNDGKLAGAGLDVIDPEPLPADHPLWKIPNVLITPHVSAGSDISRRNTLMIARENLRRYVQGDKLLNLVSLERGY
jgi:phosphoglycerate dehydrogenase-like enzyme